MCVERDRRIGELTRQGFSATQIADIVGVTPRSVHRARGRLGLAQPTPPRLSDSERIKVEQLLGDGASYRDIAITLGRDPVTIANNWPGHAWSRRKAAEAGVLGRKLARLRTI